MTIDEDPKARLKVLPRFTPPTHHPSQSPSTSPEGETPTTGPAGGFGGPDAPPGPRQGRDLARTESSSTGSKPTKAETAGLVAGLLGLVVVGAAGLVRWRTKRKLRRPTVRQIDDIAAPLARIALRTADLSWLNPTLADLIAAGAATGEYLSDGPLLEGPEYDDGIPDDLQEDPQ